MGHKVLTVLPSLIESLLQVGPVVTSCKAQRELQTGLDDPMCGIGNLTGLKHLFRLFCNPVASSYIRPPRLVGGSAKTQLGSTLEMQTCIGTLETGRQMQLTRTVFKK